jgi:hypothetical protein
VVTVEPGEYPYLCDPHPSTSPSARRAQVRLGMNTTDRGMRRVAANKAGGDLLVVGESPMSSR